MAEERSGLFEVRFNEQGKKYIRKFAAISYSILVLVVFESLISIYWNIKFLATTARADMYNPVYVNTTYDQVYPYFSIVLSVLGIISNTYYVRFPNTLLRAMELKDEAGANEAFGGLLKGAMIFFFWVILSSANLIWSMTIRSPL